MATQSYRRSTIIAISLAALLSLSSPLTPAVAADLGGVATSSVSYSSIDSTSGVISGGTPQAFDPAFGGWRGPAFDAVGQWGLQKTLHTDNPDRSVFAAWNEATTIEQGALSTLSLDAHIISDSLTRNTATEEISLQGNSIRFVIGVNEFWAGSFERMRMFFSADLAAGANVVYTSLGDGTLLATDSSGSSPAVIITASATVGTIDFASRSNHTVSLSNGDPELTVYVNDLVGTATEVTIYAFVLDGDPCSADALASYAAEIASDPAGSFGDVLDVSSSCLASNDWELLTTAEAGSTLTISVDDSVTTPSGSTRRFSLGGLPSFLSASVDDSVSPAVITTSYSSDAVVGDYSLTLSSWLETPTGGSTRSQPMTQLVTLSISEPAPEPEPEPEPTPESAPEVEVATASTPTSSSPDSSNDDEEIVEVLVAPAPTLPRLPARPAEPVETEVLETEVSEPNFELQESTPATPLPEALPTIESAGVTPATPTANIWTSWWLWLIVGLSAIWWAWLGWSPFAGRKGKQV